MTVQELIEELSKIEDKSRKVFFCDNEEGPLEVCRVKLVIYTEGKYGYDIYRGMGMPPEDLYPLNGVEFS